jgi:transcriptional regulator of acetoin/glycerol metabolism
LDEIAELPMDVQSKLLRVLETGEVLRLGATRHEKVNVAICAATWRDLREEASAGRFRHDLYFRIAQAEVRLPPLRERAEEIPWHIEQVVAECGREGKIEVAASLVEACALRAWPGNVRELRAELRRALATACAVGSRVLSAEALSTTAGHPMAGPQDGEASDLPDDEFAAALAAEGGNVAGAARRLGVHRNRVRRWLDRHDVEAARFKTTDTKPR